MIETMREHVDTSNEHNILIHIGKDILIHMDEKLH